MDYKAFGRNETNNSNQTLPKPEVEEKNRQTTEDTILLQEQNFLQLSHKALEVATEIFLKIEEDVDLIEEELNQNQIEETIACIVSQENVTLSRTDRQKVKKLVLDDLFGYGPITDLLEDPTVSEIMVNGASDIYAERNGQITKTPYTFQDDDHIMKIIDRIVLPLGRRVDKHSPIVDARLPDGSRVNIVIPPLAVKGPSITIRKFSTNPFTVEDLVSFGSFNSDMATFLDACVKGKINILVSGGTGSGKTTLLNVLSSFIPVNERIVTVEDAAEVQLRQPHVVTLESRPADSDGRGKISIRELVVNSLRMRPDRILVGEVRSGEALDMLQAMNTGHDGSLTTIHANSPRDSIARLETMVLMTGLDLPTRAIREQIASGIHLIVQAERLSDGARKVTKITEIVGLEGDKITLQDLYIYRQDGFDEKGKVLGKHVPTGISPIFLDKLKRHGQTVPSSIFRVPTVAPVAHGQRRS